MDYNIKKKPKLKPLREGGEVAIVGMLEELRAATNSHRFCELLLRGFHP